MKVHIDREKRKKQYYIWALICALVGFSIFHFYDIIIYPEITLKVIIRSVFIGYCLLLLVLIYIFPNRYINIFDFLIFIPSGLMLTVQCFISDGFANNNYAGFVMIILIASLLIEIKPLRFFILLVISVSAHFIILSFYPVFSEKGFYSHLIYILLSAFMGLFLNYLVNQMREREIQNLSEKEILLKEIHHRVKNNLQLIISLLNLQSGSTKDPDTKTVLIESQDRVKSMALIHQLLYQSNLLTRVDFSKYLDQLMGSLYSSYKIPGKSISFTVHAKGIEFDIDTAIPLGLITNELASNAFKYAFAQRDKGKIDVSVRKVQERKFLLTVSDNGIGLPDDYKIEKANTLGLKLVKLLTRQIEGKLVYENHSGTTFKIGFSVRANTNLHV